MAKHVELKVSILLNLSDRIGGIMIFLVLRCLDNKFGIIICLQKECYSSVDLPCSLDFQAISALIITFTKFFKMHDLHSQF